MPRIIIPFLEIGGERVETPIGFSELLDPVWSSNVDTRKTKEIASQFECTTYKNEKGRWVTCFEKKSEVSS